MRKLYFNLGLVGNRIAGCFRFLFQTIFQFLPLRHHASAILTGVVSVTLIACSTVLNNMPGVYKLEVQQGNIVDQTMIDQLRPNMNQRQVLYIMGSPMVVDVFDKTRWDYIYSDQPSGEDRVQKRISLIFKNDQLTGIQGDFRPGTQPTLKTTGESTVDVPKRDIEKTLWEKITGIFSSDDDVKPAESEPKAEPVEEKAGANEPATK
jgi:outer membrane protein assembly factor BamE